MIFVCLHCRSDLMCEPIGRTLAICPVCEFVFAIEPGGPPTVPTFAEEESLPRVRAKRTVTAGVGRHPDATQVGDTSDIFGNLPLPQRKVLYLEVVDAPNATYAKGTIFRLGKGRVTLGRSGADIVIDDERVSRKHAVIEAISRENIYLKDLASTNGTYLNDQRISSSKLHSGDQIRIGSTTLRFVAEDT